MWKANFLTSSTQNDVIKARTLPAGVTARGRGADCAKDITFYGLSAGAFIVDEKTFLDKVFVKFP